MKTSLSILFLKIYPISANSYHKNNGALLLSPYEITYHFLCAVL